MPPPLPPPPPFSAPPTPLVSILPSGPKGKGKIQSASTDRNALLSAIRKGANLKQTVTNDRSDPLLNGKCPNQSSTCNDNNNGAAKAFSNNNGPVALGSLFSQGMPKLCSTNQSFLQGGTYKSQLNLRQKVNNFAKQNHMPDANTGNCPPDSPFKTLNLKPAQKFSTLSYGSKPPFFDNKQQTASQLPSHKPNHQFSTATKAVTMRNILQNNLNYPRTTSEPDLSFSSTATKQKMLTKPLPPPRVLQASCTVETLPKFDADLIRRSFEDTDASTWLKSKPVVDGTADFVPGTQMLNNRSEPTNLNKITQNAVPSYPVVPARQYNKRCPVKPTTAPPPLPNKATPQNDINQNNMKATRAHDEIDNALPPPPSAKPLPPPPRVMPMDFNTVTKPLPAVPKQISSLVQHKAKTNGFRDFNTAFKFHNASEFPAPHLFTGREKIYLSEIIKNQTLQRRRSRQPPPPAPPPPPPPVPSR